MLAGHSGYDVTEAAVAKFPAYDTQAILAAAADHFRRAGVAEAEPIRGFCIEAYRDIYQKSLAIGDLSTALKALARLEKTAGAAPSV